MILHFSHIGLTEGRTFTLKSRSFAGKLGCGSLTGALATVAVAATSMKSRSLRPIRHAEAAAGDVSNVAPQSVRRRRYRQRGVCARPRPGPSWARATG